MKRILGLGILLAVMVNILPSCDRIVTYNDGYTKDLPITGAPVIQSITTMEDTSSSITSGDFNQVILLHGSNLGDVKSIVFNGLQADLHEVYATGNAMGVRIPNDFPVDSSHSIIVTTSKGTVTFPFVVKIPQLTVALENSSPAKGDNINLVGHNFKIYGLTQKDALLTLDGVPVNILGSTDSTLSIVVPVDVNASSKLVLTSDVIQKQLQHNVVLTFTTAAGIPVLNFYTVTSTGKQAVVSDGSGAGDPAPLAAGQKFFRLKNILASNFTWISVSWNFMDPISSGNSDLVQNFKNYNLKFEFLTNNYTINSGALIIGINGQLYQWFPASAGAYSTNGKWVTITIPGTSFNNGNVGLQMGTNVNSMSLDYMVGADPTTPDICVTNFRFIHK